MIKDRVVLGVLSGLIGNTAKTIIDEISLTMKISQRTFTSTAAGVFVSKKSESQNIRGKILGSLFDYGMGAIGGIVLVELLSKRGRDHLTTKGLVFGVTMGSFINFLLNSCSSKKIKAKDAASNLSYMLSHGVYGLITAYTAALLGHKSLFETKDNTKYHRRKP